MINLDGPTLLTSVYQSTWLPFGKLKKKRKQDIAHLINHPFSGCMIEVRAIIRLCYENDLFIRDFCPASLQVYVTDSQRYHWQAATWMCRQRIYDRQELSPDLLPSFHLAPTPLPLTVDKTDISSSEQGLSTRNSKLKKNNSLCTEDGIEEEGPEAMQANVA